MGKTDLLTLPPELRNKILGHVMGTGRDIRYTVHKGKVTFYKIFKHVSEMQMKKGPSGGKMPASNTWAHTSEDLSILAPLQINRQLRAETVPVFYHNNTITVFCHAIDLRIVAKWLAEHVAFSVQNPVEHRLQLNVAKATWHELKFALPIVSLVHAGHLRGGALPQLWCLSNGHHRGLKQAYDHFVYLAKKSRDEKMKLRALKKQIKPLCIEAPTWGVMRRRKRFITHWENE